VSQVFFKIYCHAFAVKWLVVILILSSLVSCAPSSAPQFPTPATPPDVAPPFDEAQAERELNDENAANTDQHGDDDLMEFEPGLGTDEAALRSAFFTGSEDFCAALFAQLGGPVQIENSSLNITWCREIARKLPVPLSAADESVAHAAGWNDTRNAVFEFATRLCSSTRCVTGANFPYPF
jgi:hypothetical protein